MDHPAWELLLKQTSYLKNCYTVTEDKSKLTSCGHVLISAADNFEDVSHRSRKHGSCSGKWGVLWPHQKHTWGDVLFYCITQHWLRSISVTAWIFLFFRAPNCYPPPLPLFTVSHSHPSLRAAPVLLLLLVRQMMATDSLVHALCGTRCRPSRPCEGTSSPPAAACFLRLPHVFNTRQQDANKVWVIFVFTHRLEIWTSSRHYRCFPHCRQQRDFHHNLKRCHANLCGCDLRLWSVR